MVPHHNYLTTKRQLAKTRREPLTASAVRTMSHRCWTEASFVRMTTRSKQLASRGSATIITVRLAAITWMVIGIMCTLRSEIWTEMWCPPGSEEHAMIGSINWITLYHKNNFVSRRIARTKWSFYGRLRNGRRGSSSRNRRSSLMMHGLIRGFVMIWDRCRGGSEKTTCNKWDSHSDQVYLTIRHHHSRIRSYFNRGSRMWDQRPPLVWIRITARGVSQIISPRTSRLDFSKKARTSASTAVSLKCEVKWWINKITWWSSSPAWDRRQRMWN